MCWTLRTKTEITKVLVETKREIHGDFYPCSCEDVKTNHAGSPSEQLDRGAPSAATHFDMCGKEFKHIGLFSVLALIYRVERIVSGSPAYTGPFSRQYM